MNDERPAIRERNPLGNPGGNQYLLKVLSVQSGKDRGIGGLKIDWVPFAWGPLRGEKLFRWPVPVVMRDTDGSKYAN